MEQCVCRGLNLAQICCMYISAVVHTEEFDLESKDSFMHLSLES